MAASAPATSKNAGVKVAVAISMLVVAGVVFAWSQGLFESAPKEAPPSPEHTKQFQEATKKLEELKKTNPPASQ